jgi:Putative DNA-binding domain
MPTLSELQREFIRAVFEPDEAPAVTPWIVGAGRSAGERLGVYRNNVWHNLREALRDVYPVVEKLVGREFFDAMATRCLREAGSGSERAGSKRSTKPARPAP